MCCFHLILLAVVCWLVYRAGCAAFESAAYEQMKSGGLSMLEYVALLNRYWAVWIVFCLALFGGSAAWLIYATSTTG